jgi:hypothetical protein
MNASTLGFAIYAADVDGNAEVEATDYARVKAHFLGSYSIFN